MTRQRIFIRTASSPFLAFAAPSGLSLAEIDALFGAPLDLDVVLLDDDGDPVALTEDWQAQVIIKPVTQRTGRALVSDSDHELVTLADLNDAAAFRFLGAVSSVELLAALGDVDVLECVACVRWLEPDAAAWSKSEDFVVHIRNSAHQPSDESTNTSPAFTFVLNADGSAVEVKVNGVSKGFALLTSDPAAS